MNSGELSFAGRIGGPMKFGLPIITTELEEVIDDNHEEETDNAG